MTFKQAHDSVAHMPVKTKYINDGNVYDDNSVLIVPVLMIIVIIIGFRKKQFKF